MNVRDVKRVVAERYAEAARRVGEGGGGCCEPAAAPCCGSDGETGANPVTSGLYEEAQLADMPVDAVAASLGCGNPSALAELQPGEVVLDLGSGGGIDVLLSARRVGPNGKAYGLDMTDEMLDLARRNQHQSGIDNVEFLKGEIENIPLPDASVDVVISNCVINLSVDKGRVLREAFRVLRPGGRFAVSDIVLRGALPPALQRSLELWAGCVAGALQEEEYLSLLAEAGFEEVGVELTRVYRLDEARPLLQELGIDETTAAEAEGRIAAAFVRARKPAEPAARHSG